MTIKNRNGRAKDRRLAAKVRQAWVPKQLESKGGYNRIRDKESSKPGTKRFTTPGTAHKRKPPLTRG